MTYRERQIFLLNVIEELNKLPIANFLSEEALSIFSDVW
jgi:hypothetical protein